MAKESAGLLLYRWAADGRLEFLLVHPGGPFWQHKDAGAWTIPKGELEEGEEPLAAAQREAEEELGFCPVGKFIELKPIRQKAGKRVRAWGVEADWDPANLRSNTFTTAWPRRSGNTQTFPEVDRAAFFDFEEACLKINPAQIGFLEELSTLVEGAA
jgi:predicted NUDIX family NTP pyrophosphohydrolase